MREDRGSVLRAHVIALTIELRRVMNLEKDLEDLIEADDGRIERDADRFGMTCPATTDIAVIRIGHVAADVTTLDALNPCQPVEYGLDTPKASCG